MPEPTPLHEATSRAGAVFTDAAGWQVPAHFGAASAEYQQARTHAALFDISHRGKVQVTGAEAAAFLHNLCTNDIRKLLVGSGCEAFFCTAQARVVARALIFHMTEGGHDVFLMDTDPGQAEKVFNHLNRHLISERVELADRTRELAQVHLAGPNAVLILEAALEGKVPELTELQHAPVLLAGGKVGLRRNDPLGQPGYDVVCAASQAAGVWEALLEAGARAAGTEAYEVLRVEGGTPVHGVDVDETRLVMDVGRTARAISYTKGCYLGQEPIVMARDRGHVNRALLGLKIAGTKPVAAGAALFRDGKDVGQVTSSVFSPALGSALALAYLRRGNWEPGTGVEVTDGSEKRTAEVVSLPFSSGFVP